MNLIFKCLLGFLLLLSLFSCNEKSSDSESGTLRILATDAPFDFEGVASAKITVGNIKLRQASGNSISVMDEEVTLDLLQLRNGLVDTLANIELPAGAYDEIILIISQASVDMKDGKHYDLKVPSGAQSGLKVFVSPDLVVTTGLSHDVLLDFDLSRSFIAQGPASNITGFSFKPVIRAVNLSKAGTISGLVMDMSELGLPGATVTISKGDQVVATAITEEDGSFKILGLSEGTYAAQAEKEGYNSLKIGSISVTVGNDVTTQFILPVTVNP